MPLFPHFADDIRALRQGADDPAAGSERERVARLAERAARCALPVLIESETGSGAEALARAIHESGDRRARPFLRLNAEDTHISGRDLSGLLHKAHGGTLFVQGVHHLGEDAQGTLLEALSLQEGSARGTRRADVRIIAATDFGLADRVREAQFMEALFYRLQALPIGLRPLRARKEAIGEFASLFLKRFAAGEGRNVRGLSADATDLLMRYDWPGNLRQLENAMYRAVLLAEGPFLTPAEFPQVAAHVEGFRIEIPPVPTARRLAPPPERAPAFERNPHVLSLIGESGELRSLAELEAQAIRFAIEHYQGQMSAVSRHLGIGRSTLYRKLKELGLNDAAA